MVLRNIARDASRAVLSIPVLSLTLVLIGAVFSAPRARGDSSCPDARVGLPVLPTDTVMWAETARDFANRAAAKDLKSFCEWNRMDRISRSSDPGTDPAYLTEYRRAVLSGDSDQAAQALSEFSSYFGAWNRSMAGHPALKSQEYKGKNELRREDAEGYRQEVINERKKLAEFFASAVPANAKFQIRDYDRLPEVAVTPSASEKTMACSQFVGITSVLSCGNALDDVEAYVRVRKANVDVTGVESLKKTQTREYAEGLRNAVNLVYSHFSEKPVPSGANVVDDLKAGFRKAGKSAAEAEDMAFESMAAISSGGPLFILRTDNRSVSLADAKSAADFPNYSAEALHAISRAIIDLDTMKMSSENPSLYSLPGNVKFPCDSGKYYHFWMEAYLSRRLMRMGYSEDVARAAPFIAHIGYQMSDLGLRNPKNQLITRRYGATENGVRIDMTMAATGASFGVDSAKGATRVMDAKAGFPAFLANGGTEPSMKPDEASSWFLSKKADAVYRFMDNLNPSYVFEQYK